MTVPSTCVGHLASEPQFGRGAEEIASERRWSESFAKSQDVLAQLADEALAEHTAGRTQPL